MIEKISPSQEQQEIIDSLKDHDVVKVQAVAGSGKSTTVFFLAQNNPNKKIIVLTYNKFLKEEMSKKIKKWKLNNISVYTFHGLATFLNIKYNHKFNEFISNDKLLNDWLFKANNQNQIPKLKFDILVADEFQDCNQLYWDFLKILMETHPNSKLLVLGDWRQTIYEFKDSHDWWLNNIDRLFENKIVANKKLSISYRLTNEVAYFINKYCYECDEELILTNKKTELKVQYWHFNSAFEKAELMRIADYIEEKINDKTYKPDDIFIICDTLKGDINSQLPPQLLENLLVQKNIQVYYPDDDQKTTKNNVTKNKVVFCTPWTAKGRERKLVFYLSFGYIYNNTINDQLSFNNIDNKTYVSLTRALEELIIVNSSNVNKFRTSYQFIDFNKLKKDQNIIIPPWSLINLNNDLKRVVHKSDNIIETLNLQGSRIGKYLSSSLELKLSTLIDSIKRVPHQKKDLIELPSFLNKKNNKIVQEISVINAILFTSLSIDKLLKVDKKHNKNVLISDVTLINTIKNLIYIEQDNNFLTDLEKMSQSYLNSFKLSNVPLLLFYANFIYCLSNKILNSMNQIVDYNWLNDFDDWKIVKDRTVSTIKKAVKKFINGTIDYQFSHLEQGISFKKINGCFIDKHSQMFEAWLRKNIDHNLKIRRFNVSGIFDYVAKNLYFEFKFIEAISLEHEIQVIFYLFLLNLWKKYCDTNPFLNDTNNDGIINFEIPNYFHLYNIRSNEWIVFENNETIIDEIITLIVKDKLKKKCEMPDNFIEKNKIK